MKYEKRKKNKTVNAVQLNNLGDAERILSQCDHVLFIDEIFWGSPGNERNGYIRFVSARVETFVLDEGDYFAWDDDNVWTMPADKFEKKFEPVRATVYGGFTTSTSDFARYTLPHPPNYYPG